MVIARHWQEEVYKLLFQGSCRNLIVANGNRCIPTLGIVKQVLPQTAQRILGKGMENMP